MRAAETVTCLLLPHMKYYTDYRVVFFDFMWLRLRFTVSRAFYQGGCLHYISPIPFHLSLNLGFSYSGYDNILESTASALPKPPQTTITQPLKRRVLNSSKNPMGLVRMRELMRMCGLQSSGMVVSFYL